MDFLVGGYPGNFYGSGYAVSGLGYGSGYAGLGLNYGSRLAGLGMNRENILSSLIAGGTIWSSGLGLTGLNAPYQTFAGALQRALGERQSLRQGKDVIMSFPPSPSAVKRTEKDRKPSEMTGEEYQNYICDRIASLNEGEEVRWNARGLLVLKEEAFDRMQKDPSYEKRVLEMLRKDLQERKSADDFYPVCRVIGGSEADCYSMGTVSDRVLNSHYGKEKSLWEMRTGRQSQHARRLTEEAGDRETLAERLERNRTSRIQERAAERYAGRHGAGEHGAAQINQRI